MAGNCHTEFEMKHPAIITTPFAGAERAAEVLGVSPARTRRLIALAKETLRQANGSGTVPSHSERPHARKKARKGKAKKSHR